METVYRFFSKHKWLLYTIIVVSTALLAFLASRIEFEEDVSKLFASIDSDDDIAVAFSDIKVKDNVFILVTCREDSDADETELCEACDMFVSSLLENDSAEHDIEDIMCTMDLETLQPILDYAIGNIALFADSTMVCMLDSMITPQNVTAQMDDNLELLMADESPVMFDVVRHDPVGLRNALFKKTGSAGGMPVRIIDGHLFSSDASTVLALCTPGFSSLDSKAGTRLFNKMSAAKTSVETEYPGVEVLYHGAPIQSVNNARRIKSDLILTLGISMVLICIIIAFCFRSLKGLLLLIAPVLFGALFSLAVMYIIQGHISLMALGIGAIVVGVAMSYSLHLLTHYKYTYDTVRVLKEEYKPILLAGITTIGAFVGLMFTDSPLLRDFGLFASFAIVGTIIACLFFVPHFLEYESHKSSFAAVEKFNSIRFDRINPLIVSLICITIVCIVMSHNVTFDSDITHIGYKSGDLIRSQQLYKEKMSGGLHSQFYAVKSSNLDSALILNRRLAAKCRSLQEIGLVKSYAQSYNLLVDSATQVARIGEWRRHFTPERCARIEQIVRSEGARRGFDDAMFEPFFEIIRGDYQPSSLYAADILPRQLMNSLVEKVGDDYLVFTSVRLDKANLKRVNDFMSQQTGVIVLDPFYYTGNLIQTMHDDFNSILAFSSMFVLLVLCLSFRNIFLALIAFIPMTLSWYVVLGVMGICGLQFNLINIIISTFIYGIGVDYSIFVMEGLVAEGTGRDTCLLFRHKTAITLSALLLMLCMASLLFAVHPAISSIGVTALIGMFSTVIMSYCIQPFIFRLFCQTRIGMSVMNKIRRKS